MHIRDYIFHGTGGGAWVGGVHQEYAHIVGHMHTEWCPAWAIRSIRGYIFNGTVCGVRGGGGGCIRNMCTLWKMHAEWCTA